MKKKIFFIIFTFFFFSQIISQNNIDNQILLAKELYGAGKYYEAAELFEDIYSNKTSAKVYKNYLDCLLKIKDFKKAITLTKNYYKKGGKNPATLIDLGNVYLLSEKNNESKEQFDLALKEAQERPNFLLSVASKFYSMELYTYALDSYTLLKEKNPKGNYSFQISNIYSQIGDTENMYEELLNLMISNEAYIQTCKNKIRITISENAENENNILLKSILIKKLQKTNSIILHEILIWLLIQEEDFSNALKQEIAIDKRNDIERDLQIFDLGEIAISNSEFIIAQEAFNYITKKETSFYYKESIIKSLEIEYSIFKQNPDQSKEEVNKLIKNYELNIEELGITNESIFTIIDLAHILAFYNSELEKAKEILLNILSKKNYSELNLAYCKLKLGDILLIENNIWEAQLYYSQVEHKFKHEVIGQEAKFKKIQIDYYTGKFNWAQSQLDILKQSTSKLIANNAMELSLIIGDNLNLDTTQLPLKLYAESELLIFQNKYDDALKKLNAIEKIYPNHSLQDNIFFQKSSIEIKRGNYELALNYLEEICLQYYNDILFDDALYTQAYIFEFTIEDYEKAKEKYQELLLKCPASIFVSESRKRYRSLRKTNP